jgi:hypothetical protein
MRSVALIVLAFGLLALAGCGSATSPKAAAPTVHPTAPSCSQQVSAWQPTGLKDIRAFGTADGKVHAAGVSLAADMGAGNPLGTDETALATGLGALQGAIAEINLRLPPACIPNLATDLSGAMTLYGNAASYQTMALGALNQDNSQGATLDLDLANAVETSANVKMQAAVSDMDAYSGT